MTKEEIEAIVAEQLNTPRGKKLFAAAFYRGVNRGLRIPDAEGEVLIQEFQEKYGTTRGLSTYLSEVKSRPKPPVH
jgi:hypothetical protein